jgi:hypothetical protein
MLEPESSFLRTSALYITLLFLITSGKDFSDLYVGKKNYITNETFCCGLYTAHNG